MFCPYCGKELGKGIIKNQGAIELGRKGGLERKRNLTPEELSAIGKRGAAIRWGKKRKKQDGKSHS